MNYSKNPSDSMKLLFRLKRQTFTQGAAELNIPDSSLIDTRDWDYVLITAALGTIGTGGMTIKFYENSSNAESGQSAISGTDVAIVNADDDKCFAGQIRMHGRKRYLNIGCVAAAGTGDCTVDSITVYGVGPSHEASDASIAAITSVAALT